MMKAGKTQTALILILLFSIAIRAYQLEAVPPGFFTDEVISAYDAYCLLHTGCDGYGSFLPLFFRAADDYRDPIHTYSMVPFIIAFGPSVFSIRMVSVFYGTLAVLLTFILARKLFDDRTALLSALLLAISPWNYIFSRISFHAITYTPFFLSGLCLFYVWLKDRKRNYLKYSALSFGIGCYTYYPARLWIPVFFIGLFLIHWKEIMKRRREVIVPLVIFAVFFAPLVYFLIFSPEKSTTRFESVSIFNEDLKKETMREMNSSAFLSSYAGSDTAVYAYIYLKNYRAHLSPDFLFFKGDDNVRHSLRGFGKLHMFQLPLVFFGILLCLIRRGAREKLLLYWLATYPMAASITFIGVPHSIRTFNAVPLFDILTAYAFISLLSYAANRKIKGCRRILKIPVALFLISLSFYAAYNVYSFYDHYFNEYPKYAYEHIHTKIGDAIAYTESVRDEYDKIVITSGCCYYSDYYMAFFTKLDPEVFQESNRRFIDPSGKYVIAYARKYCEDNINDSSVLFVLKDEKFLNVSGGTTIYNPDDSIAFRIGSRCVLEISPYIQNWLVCGPFPNNRSTELTPDNYWDTSFDYGLFIDYVNEGTTEPYSGGECGGKTWFPHSRDDDEYMDLDGLFNMDDEVIAYAHAYVYSPTERNARIWYGSDDGIRIWLNNMPVQTDHRHRPASPDTDSADVRLSGGWNRLLVKVEDVTGSWGFYMRLTDLENREIPDIGYSIEPPLQK
ncbi:MAG: glycosyltransferase family 39 protein [Candidatus Altiarchaeota archaeon]|nr:glycosyltransferase family 39 protein [Candidatus Altiarchaeota archaeon]